MNWINLMFISIITTGGFIAATYEVLAKREGLPVAFYFRQNGIMVIIGGLVTFGAIVFSAFINPWWSILIVFIIGWFFSQLFVRLFKVFAQLLSLLLIVSGIIALTIRL